MAHIGSAITTNLQNLLLILCYYSYIKHTLSVKCGGRLLLMCRENWQQKPELLPFKGLEQSKALSCLRFRWCSGCLQLLV